MSVNLEHEYIFTAESQSEEKPSQDGGAPMSATFDNVQFSDNPWGARTQRALIAKFSIICNAKGCNKNRSETHVAAEKKAIEEGQLYKLKRASSQPQTKLCEDCWNNSWKVFKPIELKDGKTIQKYNKDDRGARARVAKEKVSQEKIDHEDRHNAMLQALMMKKDVEPVPEEPPKSEYEIVDPAEIEKMSNAEKKEYLSGYLEWYTENAKASTAKGMSFSLNEKAPSSRRQ